MQIYEADYRCWTVGAVPVDGGWHPTLNGQEGAATTRTPEQALSLAIRVADALDQRHHQRQPYAEIRYGAEELVVIRYENGKTYTSRCQGLTGPALERPCKAPAEVMVGSTSLCRGCAEEAEARTALDAEYERRLATA